MKTLVTAACFIAGLLGLSTPGFAWSDAGQKTTCYIAYAEMKPETRAAIDKMIPGGADAFADACTWAPAHWLTQQRKDYDYITVSQDTTALGGDACPTGAPCLLDAIADNRDMLVAANTRAPDRIRALKLLSYFVGRIHQPMAVNLRENGGGQPVDIVGLAYCNGNLEYLWSNCMVGYTMMLQGIKKTTDFAQALDQSITTEDREKWRAVTAPTDWANESLKVVTYPAFGYCVQGPDGCGQTSKHSFITSSGVDQKGKLTMTVRSPKLSKGYVHRLAPLVELRLKQAGVRLAAMLDNALAVGDPAGGGGAASR